MKIAHILRKYNPLEWAGTETAVLNLAIGLRKSNTLSKIFCPSILDRAAGPFELNGFDVQSVKSFLPAFGLSEEQKKRLIAIGGNIFSWQLLNALWKEKDLSCIHSHCLGLFGAIGMQVASLRKIPFVISIHGGALDLPQEVLKNLQEPMKGAFNWGKVLSFFFQTRSLLQKADLILTCNEREKLLLKAKYPNQRVVFNPHSIDSEPYQKDKRKIALNAFPQLQRKTILLCVARVDLVKNQLWLIERLPALLSKYRDLKLVFVGAITDHDYYKKLLYSIQLNNLSHVVEWIGELPYGDERLLGLYQQASAVVLPSIAEPFGFVVLESWAAKTPILSSRTSGPKSLISDKKNGWLFDIDRPISFEKSVEEAFSHSFAAKEAIENGWQELVCKYDINSAAFRVKQLYSSCIKEKSL